ncbi:MAG: D-alanyl-D-alanine carboxypeptidase family protein [Woeseiaceae bacterium]
MSYKISRRNLLKTGATTLFLGAVSIPFLKDEKDSELEAQHANNELVKNEIINTDSAIKDQLDKVKNFNKTFANDIFLTDKETQVFVSVLNKINAVKKTVGYANFNLLSFDDMLLFSSRYSKLGRFSQAELKFIDEVFSFDAGKYGFYGDKVISQLTSKINKKETLKISGSGHYLFHGDAEKMYQRLQKDIGPELVLTSGVRSVVKQLQLFLEKVSSSKGNLSLASRSLAPPGHSYHGIGDFDVGKKGFGYANFTSDFATTNEYKKLIKLKYVDLRYTLDNQVGVRYEPWHIKVV